MSQKDPPAKVRGKTTARKAVLEAVKIIQVRDYGVLNWGGLEYTATGRLERRRQILELLGRYN